MQQPANGVDEGPPGSADTRRHVCTLPATGAPHDQHAEPCAEPPGASASSPSGRPHHQWRSASSQRLPSHPLAEATADVGWHGLVAYCFACVQHASAAPPPAVTAARDWTPLPLDVEEVVTGRAGAVSISPSLRALIDATGEHQDFVYGWPVLVTRAPAPGAGEDRAAPLLITVLQRPAADDETVLASDEPQLNPALLTDNFFPADPLAAEPSAGHRASRCTQCSRTGAGSAAVTPPHRRRHRNHANLVQKIVPSTNVSSVHSGVQCDQ